jgi:hypothetical protein
MHACRMPEIRLRLTERRDRIRFGRAIICSAADLLLLAVLGAVPTESGAQESLQRAWTFPAAELTEVEVKLVRGNAVIRRSSDMYVRVFVSRSGEPNASVAPVVQAQQGGNALRIVASYAKSGLRSDSECLPIADEHGDLWSTRDVVDVELQVPLRMNVKVHSMQGSIELTALEGSLDVSTNDGALAIETSAGEPIVTATGSVAFIQHARGETSAVPSKLAVHDGDIQVWAKRGELAIIDGRSFRSPMTNIEIARSNDAKTLVVAVDGESAEVPTLIEFSRSSLNVSSWNSP